MTTKLILPDWSGQAVAVLASGRSLTKEAVAAVAGMKKIAVRRAVRMVPDAEIVLALDAPPNVGFWDEVRDFAGLKVCGVECELDAMYLGMQYERVTLAPGHVIEIRNNGLAAIRLAAATGATRITLVGFDGPPYEHFYGDGDPDVNGYPGLAEGLAALTSELRSRGITVEHYTEPANGL